MSEGFYGPSLPPSLLNNSTSNPGEKDSDNDSDRAKSRSGKFLRKRKHSDSSSSCTDSGESSQDSEASDSQLSSKANTVTKDSKPTPKFYGPCLLPSQAAETSVVDGGGIIGPVLPPHLAALVAARQKEQEEEEEELLRFGPRPDGRVVTNAEAAAAEIEERANRMKNKLLGLGGTEDSGEVQRESWMTDLPPELVPDFGVTARKFRTKAPTNERGADRSSWTDTPADRARREQDALEGKQPVQKKVCPADYAQAKKDMEYATLVDEYNKSSRTKSLMDLHTEKLQGKQPTDDGDKKKKRKHKHKEKNKRREKDRDDKSKHKEKKKKDKHDRHAERKNKKDDKDKEKRKKEEKPVPVVRKPFDRELDLKSSRMDAAARKSLIGKSQQLGGRFGHGSAQFL